MRISTLLDDKSLDGLRRPERTVNKKQQPLFTEANHWRAAQRVGS
jgi:hypothetical protein